MVQFRFSSEQPPQQLFTDIQTLNHFDEEQLSELIGILLGFLSSSGDLVEGVEGNFHTIFGSF